MLQKNCEKQKRVLAIHDISCVGRCSLTVALPIISAVGIETSLLPTAVLSTHTGGFTGYTYRDLTDDILPIADHWEKLGLEFDAIYTGYLGSFEQIDIISEVIKRFKGKDTLVVVDPVMADNGKLYPSFPENFPEGMRSLVAIADVVLPNMTETALLLGEPYKKGPHTREETEGMLKRLSAIGPGKVVLTGVCFGEGELGAASYVAETGEVNYAMQKRIPQSMHGTGDVFGSALVAGLMSGHSIAKSCELAVGFTVDSIKRTLSVGDDIDTRYGVRFEQGLGEFIAAIRRGKWLEGVRAQEMNIFN